MAYLFCPIIKDDCVGRNCALAVEIKDPFLDRWHIYWQCSLVNSNCSGYKHTINYIDSERVERDLAR